MPIAPRKLKQLCEKQWDAPGIVNAHGPAAWQIAQYDYSGRYALVPVDAVLDDPDADDF